MCWCFSIVGGKNWPQMRPIDFLVETTITWVIVPYEQTSSLEWDLLVTNSTRRKGDPPVMLLKPLLSQLSNLVWPRQK